MLGRRAKKEAMGSAESLWVHDRFYLFDAAIPKESYTLPNIRPHCFACLVNFHCFKRTQAHRFLGTCDCLYQIVNPIAAVQGSGQHFGQCQVVHSSLP